MPTEITTTSQPRPAKVLAFLLFFFSFFLMIVSISASDWISTDHGSWREGLFERCAKEGALTPLPFGMKPVPGCVQNRFSGYIVACIILSIICLLTDFAGMWLTGSGLKSNHPRRKYKKYKIATVFLIIALVSILIVVVIFPVMLFKDLETNDNNPVLDGSNVTKVEVPKEPENLTDIEETEPDSESEEGSANGGARVKRDEDCDGEDCTEDLADDGLIPEAESNGEDDEGPRRNIEGFALGFGYWCSLVSTIFIFVGVVILLFDQNKEEIYYKEVSIALSGVQDAEE